VAAGRRADIVDEADHLGVAAAGHVGDRRRGAVVDPTAEKGRKLFVTIPKRRHKLAVLAGAGAPAGDIAGDLGRCRVPIRGTVGGSCWFGNHFFTPGRV
jgi:hypothetical protein